MDASCGRFFEASWEPFGALLGASWETFVGLSGARWGVGTVVSAIVLRSSPERARLDQLGAVLAGFRAVLEPS